MAAGRGGSGAEAPGSVVLGIEADAEEVGLCVETGTRGQLLVNPGEVARDPGAKVRQRTAGIDEGDQARLAAELVQMDGAATLVAPFEVRHQVTWRRNVVGSSGLVIGLGLGHDHDVVQNHVDTGVIGDHHIGSDDVARMQFAQDARIFDLVGHGHGVHKAGDGLMIDDELALSDSGGNHLSAQLVDLQMLIAFGLRGGCLAGVTPGQSEGCKQPAQK